MNYETFSYIGVLFTSYLFLKYLLKIYHALRVYIFPTYPDFSKYGKWSGKYCMNEIPL